MCPQIEVMLGDALYSNRKTCCSITEGYGIRPYSLLKTNTTFSAKGAESWKTIIYGFIEYT